VDVEHIDIAKTFEEEINFLLKGSVERQPTKKRTIVSSGSIVKFFSIKDSFKSEYVP
jgi:hypothetical protein